MRLRGLAPAPVEQDGDGLYACAGRRIGLTHDGSKRAHRIACIGPGTMVGSALIFSLLAKGLRVVPPPVGAVRRGDNHTNDMTQKAGIRLPPV
jgi:hypothetical protein